MRALSNGLVDSVERSRLVAHALTKGEIREEDVIAAFRPFIPERFSLGKGIVVNADGDQSEQQDLVIADAQAGTRFIASGNLGVYPVEIVHCVVQIKSRATPADVRRAVENVASVKRLLPGDALRFPYNPMGVVVTEARPAHPFGGILCLTPPKSRRGVAGAFAEANSNLGLVLRSNAMCIVGDSVLSWAQQVNDDWQRGALPSSAEHIVLDELGDDSLLLFYVLLINGITTFLPPPFSVIPYATLGGGIQQRGGKSLVLKVPKAEG
jgi:Domain of unknown function (DUF6602)